MESSHPDQHVPAAASDVSTRQGSPHVTLPSIKSLLNSIDAKPVNVVKQDPQPQAQQGQCSYDPGSLAVSYLPAADSYIHTRIPSSSAAATTAVGFPMFQIPPQQLIAQPPPPPPPVASRPPTTRPGPNSVPQRTPLPASTPLQWSYSIDSVGYQDPYLPRYQFTGHFQGENQFFIPSTAGSRSANDDFDQNIPKSGKKESSSSSRRTNLPKETVDILNSWLLSHLNNPYPTPQEKRELLIKTGLSKVQLSNWFINVRRRKIFSDYYQLSRSVRSNETDDGSDPELEKRFAAVPLTRRKKLIDRLEELKKLSQD